MHVYALCSIYVYKWLYISFPLIDLLNGHFVLWVDLFVCYWNVLGIRQSSSITYHGIALNCTTEPLSWLRQIVPCGLANRDVTCLSEACGKQCTPMEVAPKMSNCLVSSLFGSHANNQFNVNYQFRNDMAGDWCNLVRNINGVYEGCSESFSVSKSWSCIVKDILFSLHSHFNKYITGNILPSNK